MSACPTLTGIFSSIRRPHPIAESATLHGASRNAVGARLKHVAAASDGNGELPGGSRIAIARCPGPGQMPERPQPIPNVALPKISRRSIVNRSGSPAMVPSQSMRRPGMPQGRSVPDDVDGGRSDRHEADRGDRGSRLPAQRLPQIRSQFEPRALFESVREGYRQRIRNIERPLTGKEAAAGAMR